VNGLEAEEHTRDVQPGWPGVLLCFLHTIIANSPEEAGELVQKRGSSHDTSPTGRAKDRLSGTDGKDH
jgi:hypothetical protein